MVPMLIVQRFKETNDYEKNGTLSIEISTTENDKLKNNFKVAKRTINNKSYNPIHLLSSSPLLPQFKNPLRPLLPLFSHGFLSQLLEVLRQNVYVIRMGAFR